MNTTLDPEAGTTGADRTFRPVAQALGASVDAVRDSLDHMDAEAVLAVPIGTPHENFDIVEWCDANRKPVINRFDPWPLETLMVQNAPSDASARSNAETDEHPDEPDPAATSPSKPSGVRRALRRIRRVAPSGDRRLDRAWHGSNVADARARMSPGVL